MNILCRRSFLLEIMTVHLDHSVGLRAPVCPLRRPLAVGGCHAHAQGPSPGGRKPLRPLEAAETARHHGLVHNITVVNSSGLFAPVLPIRRLPAAGGCRAHAQGPSAAGGSHRGRPGAAGMAYGWRPSSSSMVRLNANTTNLLGVTQ